MEESSPPWSRLVEMSLKLGVSHFISGEAEAQKGGPREVSHLPGPLSREMSFDLWERNPALKRQ